MKTDNLIDVEVYGPAFPHDDALITGTRVGLCKLGALITAALEDGRSAAQYCDNGGECGELSILVVEQGGEQ